MAATLAELRIKAKLTQAALAGKMDVEQSTVAGWETGAHTPLPKRWKRLANILGVSRRTIMELFT